MNTPAFQTERLVLRKFTREDFPAIFKIYSDVEVNKFLPWFPLQSENEVKDFFEERYAKAYEQGDGYRYAICLKSDGIPIGYVHVSGGDSYDLGYGLRKEFWHKGIVTEACKRVVGQLKEDGVPYITATHDVKNPRSGNVMRHLGMEYQYSYKEQWQPKNILVTFRMYQLNLDGKNQRVYRKYWNMYEEHFIEHIERKKENPEQ